MLEIGMADLRVRYSWQIDGQAAAALARGVDGNPFALLGPHDTPEGRVIRAFLPGATKVEVLRRSDGAVLAGLAPGSKPGLFENLVPERVSYRLRIAWPDAVQE